VDATIKSNLAARVIPSAKAIAEEVMKQKKIQTTVARRDMLDKGALKDTHQ